MTELLLLVLKIYLGGAWVMACFSALTMAAAAAMRMETSLRLHLALFWWMVVLWPVGLPMLIWELTDPNVEE